MQRLIHKSMTSKQRIIQFVPQIQFLKSYSEAVFIAAKEPFVVDLEAKKRYAWCSCGRSKKQPFCDGSHKKTGLKPLRFELDENNMKVLCGCKQTSTPPYCDGTHLSELVQSSEIGQPCKTE